ncbi:MAG: transposase [Candidatus Cloacimonetes bacterium]|nr:transposase [Candidatus Cloacimonadota bacterium]
MARKREGDDLKLQIVDRNGKKYAYRCTSQMVNGRKKTISEYVGRMDAETGRIVEKKKGKTKAEREKIASEKRISVRDSFVTKEYGGTHFLDCIQRKLHLGEDLYESFGSSSTTILSIASAMAMSGTNVFMDVEPEFERTDLRWYYDITMSMDSGSLSEFTHTLGLCASNIDGFYGRRVRRCNTVVAWDTTTQGTYSDVEGLAEWLAKNKDNEDIRQVKTGIATDIRGVPLFRRHYPATVSDIDTVKEMVNDLGRYGSKDYILAMDRGFVSGANMKYVLDNSIRFVAPAVTSSKAVKTLLTKMGKRKCETRIFDDHAYDVWETDLGLLLSDNRTSADGGPAYSFTENGSEDHAKDGKLKAFVCFDSKKYSDEVQNHHLMLNSIMARAETIDSPNPVKTFNNMAGKAAKYFDIIADGRHVKPTVKNNSKTFLENRAGMFVMLVSEDVSWEAMMAAYDARRLAEQAFDCEKTADKRFRTGDKVTLEGREFIRFIALMMKSEIAAAFREANLDSKYTVDSALASLNCMNSISAGRETWLHGVTKAHRMMFEAIGCKAPAEPEHHRMAVDMEYILAHKE